MRLQGHDVIVKMLVGSRAYGTEVEGSDWDYKGVFIQDPLHLFLHGPIKIIEISEDEIYYELGYFARLCCNQNPTILEMLYVPEDCVIYSTEHWRRFQNKRDLILSKEARHSYKGYVSKEFKELTRGGKQLAHIFRLTHQAYCIAHSHTIIVRQLDGGETLKHIRTTNKSVIRSGDDACRIIDKAFDLSKLRDKPDVEKVMEKVMDIKKEYFKRYDNTRRYSEGIQATDV